VQVSTCGDRESQYVVKGTANHCILLRCTHLCLRKGSWLLADPCQLVAAQHEPGAHGIDPMRLHVM
jgi:hypothetical protein